MCQVFMMKGKSRTISTSKTKKITASKKNRIDMGIRADVAVSNPHSKADLLPRFFEVI